MVFTQAGSLSQMGSPRDQHWAPCCSTSSLVVLMMELKTPSPSLLMTLNSVVRWTHQKGQRSKQAGRTGKQELYKVYQRQEEGPACEMT